MSTVRRRAAIAGGVALVASVTCRGAAPPPDVAAFADGLCRGYVAMSDALPEPSSALRAAGPDGGAALLHEHAVATLEVLASARASLDALAVPPVSGAQALVDTVGRTVAGMAEMMETAREISADGTVTDVEMLELGQASAISGPPTLADELDPDLELVLVSTPSCQEWLGR